MEPGFSNPLSCQNYLMRKGDCIIPPTPYLPRAQRTCPVLYAEEGGRPPKGPQTWSGGLGVDRSSQQESLSMKSQSREEVRP